MTKKLVHDYHSYTKVSSALFHDEGRNWVHPAFYMNAGKDHFFYSQSTAGDSYMLQTKNYFIAPFDGLYSFNVVADDRAQLNTDFNSEDGSYKADARLVWAMGVDDRQGRSNESGGKRRNLAKGEKVYIEAISSEWGGNDRLEVGVIYHGKDASGTWLDKREKKHFPQDQYAYDIQRLWFDNDGREERTWLTLRVDHAAGEAGEGIGEGETFDKSKGVQFRIEQCGDNNNCFQTTNIDTENWSAGDMENFVQENWLTTECEYSGLMKPLIYHGQYEPGAKEWPGAHHFVAGRHGYCGRKAHEVHNHQIWNTNIPGSNKFKTGTANDICFAYLGNIQYFQVYGSFDHKDGYVWRNWMTVPVSLQSDSWTFTCLKISDELDAVFSVWKEEADGEYFDVSNIQVSNDNGEPIYIDELHLGNMRQQIQVTRTNTPLAFNGQVPVSVDIHFNKSKWWGAVVRFIWKTWNTESLCGYRAPLPKLIPFDDNSYTTTISDQTSGDDHTGIFVKPYDSFAHHTENEGVPREYTRETLSVLRPDNSRFNADVFAFREQIMNDEWDVDVKLTLEGRSGELNFKFTRDVYAKDLRDKLVETWPFLGSEQTDDLNIQVVRHGWCNDGYNFYIKTQQHGQMPKINMEYTLNSDQWRYQIFSERDYLTGVHTQIMPGSVTATAHELPQIVVTANGQRSACSANCDFAWRADHTATLDDIQSANSQLTRGDSITVTFDIKAYDGTLDNAQVLISGAASVCDTDSITEAGTVRTMNCVVGDVPVSTGHTIQLAIPELGTADYTGDAVFTSASAVTSYEPNVGSKWGGTIVTVSGTGFAAGEVVTVNIGGADTECDSAGFEVTYDTLICATRTNYVIAAGATPEVDSVSVNSFTVMGGQEFTILGSGFDAQDGCEDNGHVMVGNQKAKIISWTETEIVAETVASVEVGQSNVVVYVCNKGNANEVTASTKLQINSVSQSFSSLEGGNVVDINGAGFVGGAEAESFAVTVGGVPCDVTETAENKITCVTGQYTANQVNLRLAARGMTNKDTGADASDITIERGQVVNWSWMMSIPGVTPQVQLQKTSNAGEQTGNNMWSELVKGNEGTFSKRFTNLGTFHYSSGLIDAATIFASGTIRVVEATDKPSRVSVNINGVEAEHIGNSNNAQPAVSPCVFAHATTAAESVDAGHYITYSYGATPKMTLFKLFDDANEAHEDAYSPMSRVRVWLGDNASNCPAGAVISFGDFDCAVTDASGVFFECNIAGTGLDVTSQQQITAAVPGMGRAYFDNQVYANTDENGENGNYEYNADMVTFAAVASTATPNKISRNGAASLVIEGAGFVDPVIYFQVDNEGAKFPCAVESFDYTTINCKLARIATSAADADQTLVGSVVVNEVTYTLDVNLQTADSFTPKITNISPTVVTESNTVITLSGSRLDELSVLIGGEECVVSAAGANNVECTMPDLATGYHAVKVGGMYGAVQSSVALTIESKLDASAISPAQGGTNGGSRVTITGFGFDENTVVTVRDEVGHALCLFCYKLSVTPSEIVFSAPRTASANVAKVTVSHEYIASEIESFDFTYVETTSSLASSSDLANLSGGEQVELNGAFDCAGASVEVVRTRDPCEAGQHNCHHKATCTPTEDGLDYTCECMQSPTGDSYGYGNGRECYWFNRRRDEIGFDDLTEDYCREQGELLDTLDIDSPAKEEYFKEYLAWNENFNTRGTYVKWYGEWACVKNNKGEGDVHEFVVVGTDKETCEADGKSTKRVHCLRPTDKHNCVDGTLKDGMGVGYRDYVGNKATTLSGHECANWEDTQWWEDRKDTELVGRNNYCTNAWNSNYGPFCAIKDIKTRTGEHILTQCGIPTCEELANRARSTCLIGAVGFTEIRDETGEDTDPAYNEFEAEMCYLGGSHEQRLLNPRRCHQEHRYGKPVDIKPIDGKPGLFYIERRLYGNEFTVKYLTIVPDAATDRQVVWSETATANSEWVIDEDAFIPGTVALRSGQHYMSAGVPYGVTDGYWMQVVHQDNINDIDKADISFKISCSSDDFGKLLEQRVPQSSVVTSVTPTCTASQITFEMPSLIAGNYKLIVRDNNGVAAGSVDASFKLDYDSVSPDEVGTGGGTEIILSGTGFTDMTKVTVCGEELPFVSRSDASSAGEYEEITFTTLPIDLTACPAPELLVTDVDSSNDAVLSSEDNGGRKRRSGSFTVDASLTPSVTALDPVRGGTAGGTSLTITGSKFGNDVANVEVTIHGAACVVESVSDSEIVCETSAFPKGTEQVPAAPVVTILGGPGVALVDDGVEFWYIDRWSSPYTWGCDNDSCKPKEGEIIVVQKGQVLLLDETTPHLVALIIDGGKMIWDHQDGIELHMDYGVINNGGSFELGTEEVPFCAGNALIKMYGHQRSINLPIYGAKVFAVRFGSISIYGCPKTTTWTELDVTAEIGDSDIVLTHPVKDDWFVGNEIIIAATGDITNFHRSEKRVIAAVSDDGYTVTLTEPLEHRHISVCNNGPNNNGFGFGWAGEICMRAEVGLLSRNIVFTGDKNHIKELAECELGAGLSLGGTQTCFQNRYGHETGSDQFGGILFLHKPDFAHIAFAEFTHAGQAFNLARYPIHFHTPGSLPTSYVRGCGIHNTFNRALTMHGVHNLTVEYNVIYNVMGLAFFLEDAVEEDNILRYNLGIMNKKSSSLLNIDSTPSVYWIPNPNNIFYGNRAAGSTHFGFWFNPPDEPTGPSAKDPQYQNFCVKNRPLGAFFNNTAHSMGQYGMWVFTDLTPTVNGACEDTQAKAIKFGEIPETLPGTNEIIPQADRDSMFGFFAWHCLRGAEVATGGAMHFVNFIAANNWVSGLAWKETFLKVYALDDLEEEGSLYKRSIVIGHMDGDKELNACGDMGIETPWKEFSFTVDDIAFYNFDEETPDLASVDLSAYPTKSELPERRCVAVDPCYGSNAFDCAAVTFYKNVKWDNCARRVTFAWEHEAALWDMDGTFAGQGANKFIVSKSDAFNPNLCSDDTSGKYDLNGEAPHGAQICDGEKNGEKFKLHRFMFNQAVPQSMEGTMAVFENQWGTTKSGFRNCRPRGQGWMVLLEGQQEYKMYFEQHQDVSNISFTGDIDDFEAGDWLTIRHDLPERVDEASIDANWGMEAFQVNGTWPTDPSSLAPYSYNLDMEKAPFSIRYTFNGGDNEENPQLDPKTKGSLTYGQDFYVKPNFYKCFFKDCIVPEPAPPTPPPTLVKCNFLDCENSTTSDYADLAVSIGQHMVIDSAAVAAANKHFKFASVFLEGTLEVDASALSDGDELVIEADHFVMNTGAQSADNLGARRKRRDTVFINNGGLIIGTAENPIPCGVTVRLQINGDKFSQSFGALPDSVPIGSKAIGGLGNVIMHGCQRKWWTTLDATLEAGQDQITVSEDVSEWVVGDEIAIASSGYDHRHTEYFSIAAISGQTLTLNTTATHPHLGVAATSQQLLGREFNQGAEVALLTRNIVIDGIGGAEDSHGARVVVTSYTEEFNGHHYVRSGAAQLSGVEFKGFGQKGYTNYDDMRAQVLFYNVDAAADAETGRIQSYVKDCSFHNGFNTAVAALFESNNLEVTNNVIFKTIGSAIKTDGTGVTIDGNVIGNVFQMQLYDDYFSTTVNANFADDEMPSGVDTDMSADAVVTNNRVVGVDGAAFAGHGAACEAPEACSADSVGEFTGNVGHSCLRGYYILRVGGECNRVAGFNFYKISHFGVLFYTGKVTQHNILDNTIIVDSRVAVGSVMVGPDSVLHLARENTLTVKNTVIIGKSDAYDCDYDHSMVNTFTTNEHLGRQKPPLKWDESAAFIFPEFVHKQTGFPACAVFDLDMDVAMYGKTCVFNTAISEYNGKCGGKDYVITTNPKNMDHTFKMDFVEGNSCQNCAADTLVNFHRPGTDKVNPADCVDLHCDGLKRGIVADGDGGLLGAAGTLFGESEFEWDGVTRGGETYSDTRDGLGDYRVPSPMTTNLDGSEIPISEVYSEAGIVRDNTCEYRSSGPAWFCPAPLEYHDVIYEMMDEDHTNRRLTPLAIRSEGFLDIVNGPADHSCCIGYACSIRLMTMHTTVACGKSYDYYFSSTLPLEAKFHFPYAPETCKIKIAFYTKRPNRVDITMDETFVPATNAKVLGDGSIEWQKPDDSFIPQIDSHNSGANYQQRDNQLIHIILSGGHTYTVKTVQTLVLELAVTTELTEDDFYDNGNLAGNIAALLGIDPSRIRVMNVISESGSRRRRRHVEEGWTLHGTRARRNADGLSLQLEIQPEKDNNHGAEALDEIATSVISDPTALAGAVTESISELDPTASVEPSVAVAAPPKAPPTPPRPVTLAEQLGVPEMTPEDDLDEFIAGLNEAAGIDITTLETASEKQAKEQAEADKAAELITYDTPTTMVLDVASMPATVQLLGQALFNPIRLSVNNQNGEHMDTVGYVADPYKVRAELYNPVMAEDGEAAPSLDGDTVMEFVPGSGYASFSNLIFRGDIKSTQIKFSIKNPSDSTVAPVISEAIEFMPAFEEGECVVTEGEGFDRKVGMSETCDYVCLSACSSFTAAAPTCNDVTRCEGEAGDETFATCGAGGCVCDMDSLPARSEINPADYMNAICKSDSIELRMNKCVINKFGFTLKDLYINGPAKTSTFDDLETSVNNNCRGALAFDNGPEYVFKIDRSFSDCKTESGTDEEGLATYKNAIQGFSGVNTGLITRRKELFIEFGCKFEVDLTVSARIGEVGSQSYVVNLDTAQGNFDVTMAVYDDSSFTRVADSDFSINVPDDVFVGIVGNNFGDSGYVIKAEECWITPDDNPDNEIRYDVITAGCENADDADNINVLENGASAQSRFSFASFEFLNQENSSLYGHCSIVVCDPSMESCAPTCGGSRRRRSEGDSSTVSFPFNVSGNGSNVKDCSSSPCVAV